MGLDRTIKIYNISNGRLIESYGFAPAGYANKKQAEDALRTSEKVGDFVLLEVFKRDK